MNKYVRIIKITREWYFNFLKLNLYYFKRKYIHYIPGLGAVKLL